MIGSMETAPKGIASLVHKVTKKATSPIMVACSIEKMVMENPKNRLPKTTAVKIPRTDIP